jgi:phage shock protein PspC (stress-responsive transcriptional regulator)
MMNEITRIHLAKVAYDIEIAAKKQLEKYIKSLETYTQDADVVQDIEIRITELLLERGVKPNGVIGTEDVAAIRRQLGEPHEFAEEADAEALVEPTKAVTSRRLYRSTDDAVLGGVLSGIATFFGINPVWPRLVFVLLLFISFGFAAFAYIIAWIIMPPARTAAEKLRLAGKQVTVKSIKALNIDEEQAQPNRVAPLLQRVFAIALGVMSAIGAAGAFVATVGLGIGASTGSERFIDLTNGFAGLGDGNAWIVWMVFGIVMFGLALLTALLSLISYAFFARKLTKRMLISAIIITVLGLASFAATLAISTTQSWRVANETRSMVRETKANLPSEFANITSLKVRQTTIETNDESNDFFPRYAMVRYVVDNGPARYELSALPSVKASVTVNGTEGEITVTVPNSFRNSFTTPLLTVYGPAVTSIIGDVDNGGTQLSYDGRTQSELTIDLKHEYTSVAVTGVYETLTAKGTGSVDVEASTVRSLIVESGQRFWVNAGTVSNLTVTQPEACPGDRYSQSAQVTVADVASGKMTYNGTEQIAASVETSCSSVTIEVHENEYND